MKAEKKQQIEIVLTLTEAETDWLITNLQSVESSLTESHASQQIRKTFYRTLNQLERRTNYV